MRARYSASTGQMCLFTATSATSHEAHAPTESSDATCSSAGHRARTSASPDAGLACPQGHVPACGGNTPASSALSGHRSSLLRTLLVLAGGGSLRSRRRWPRSGTGGLTFVSELATSATATNATVCSSLLPTLQANDFAYGDRKRAEAGGVTASNGRRWGLNLRDMVLLPTLTAKDGSSGPMTSRPPRRQGADNLRDTTGGTLCPTWCEQFMGFPAGWTELSASAIRSYRSRRRRRGAS